MMNKKAKRAWIALLSLLIVFGLIAAAGVTALSVGSRKKPSVSSLYQPENSVRFTEELKGELASSLEITSVTVMPLYKSYAVAYEHKDTNSTKDNLGALVHIYIKNISDRILEPGVLFGGRTASDYIFAEDGKVSWANTPDTREEKSFNANRKDKDGNISKEFLDFTELSVALAPGQTDCYSVNFTDGKFLENGLEMQLYADGETASTVIYADYQYLSLERILWTSSADSAAYPDGFLFYLRNTGTSDAVINSVELYDGTENYYDYWWTESGKDFQLSFFSGNQVVSAGQLTGEKVLFSEPVPSMEYLVKFNVTHHGKTYSLIHKSRPMVHYYDVASGWANEDVQSETYLKLITSMHFNTVIYNIHDSYMQLPQEIKDSYPIKWFNGGSDKLTFGSEYIPDNPETPENETVINIDDTHADLTFGEPQLDDGKGRFQPMRCMNKLMMYRNIPVSTNITLSHEPAFYRYAGLSDYVHYDAYRINAPFSDFWPFYWEYAKTNKYGWWFAAPLETTGDYMRSLVRNNYPNSVAAWTQGACTWNIFRRFSKTEQYRYSPNPFELRAQAYQNIANGATSLYWFNIKADSILYNRTSAEEMMAVNREFAVVSKELATQIPYFYQRSNNFDLNANVGEDYALLFINDLNYSLKSSEYQYAGARARQQFSFELPSYLIPSSTKLVKISKDGVSEIPFIICNGRVEFVETVNMTGLYYLGLPNSLERMETNYQAVLSKETFNIFDNEADLAELCAYVGVDNAESYKPKNVREENLIFYKGCLVLGLTGGVLAVVILTVICQKIRRRLDRKILQHEKKSS